ncbi:MAG: aminoglycoside N(3)-acetyltransferase [Actinomycetota bacterium]
MSEERQVARTPEPVTVTSLTRDLEALGIRNGATLLIHSSLKAVGWVAGGAHAVVIALQHVLGDEGTLIMPSHSSSLSDPATWSSPPVPKAWFDAIRDETPAFDPDMTPTRGMGAIVDCFRSQRDALRSNHPSESFCARGPLASRIVTGHSLSMCFGERSPLARLYDLDAFVLLLGVGHESNTSYHLAEYRAHWPSKRVVAGGAPILVDGERRWEHYEDVDLNSDDFTLLGDNFERDSSAITMGRVGLADCRLMPQRDAVDFAVGWIESNRY